MAYGVIEFYRGPVGKHTTTSIFTVDKGTALPRVDIIMAHGNMDGAMIDAAVAAGAKGVVIAGVGNGNMTAGGIAILSGIEDSDEFGFGDFFEALGAFGLTAAGAGKMISGLTALVLASGPVREYASVKGLTDGGERERASREALVSLARSGKLKRLIFAGIF